MRTKQKTPFAAIFPWKCFFRGDLRLAEAKAGLMRNMVVDAFLYPLQRETEIFLACARQCQQGNSPAPETIWNLPLWPQPVEPGGLAV